MAIRSRNSSSYAPVVDHDHHHETQKSNNKNTQHVTFDDRDIDGPSCSKKHHSHHSHHAMKAGDIDYDNHHHRSKHKAKRDRHAEDEHFKKTFENFVTKTHEWFNKLGNSPHMQQLSKKISSYAAKGTSSGTSHYTEKGTSSGTSHYAEKGTSSGTSHYAEKAPSLGTNHNSNNLDQAAANTHIKFQKVIRGDEAAENAKIHDQASFAKAVDKTALEYGLDPNQFRAQLEKESGAMHDYKKAMKLEGDLGRRSDNNTSIGMGQISRKFLDGREWSDGGPNNKRVGGQTVTTEMYNSSAITQLRVAASNLAMRIQDHGGGDLKKGLNYYVSGHTQQDSHNIDYITSINKIMQDKELMNIGRN